MNSIFDTHVHLCEPESVTEFTEYMRRTGVQKVVSLSLPDLSRGSLNAGVLEAKRRLPDLVYALGSLDYRGLVSGEKRALTVPTLADQMMQMWAMGFDGLKMWIGKPSFQVKLGFGPDHPEVIAALDVARKLDMPVLIHSGEPPQFWDAAHAEVEQRLGVSHGDRYGDFWFYVTQAEAIADRHPGLRIVFAHLLFLAGDLNRLARVLDTYPDVCVDLAPGRYLYPALSQSPERARDFFSSYQDRILFGSDGFWFPSSVDYLAPADLDENCLRAMELRKFLETDETFVNPFALEKGRVPTVQGLRLPPRVLRAVCWENGNRLFGHTPRRVSE